MSATIVGRNTEPASVAGRTRLTLKHVAILAALASACAGAAWYGYGWWTTGRFVQTTDDAYVGGNVTTIAPHVGGFVTDILVADNEHVQGGQLLARLDRRDYQAAYDRAQAVVDARVAALSNLHAQILLQQSSIQQSVADQAAKGASAVYARIDGARYAYLAQSSAGSRQEAQKSQAARQEAEAALAASRAGLDASRQQLKVLDTQIAEAQAVIAQSRSDLRTAALNLGYTEIRSPIEGYVGNRAAQIGAYVAVGSYLLSVVPAHGLWIDANFKEDQLARMISGQPVAVVVDVAPGRILHGRVESLAPGTGALFSVIPPENATGNFTKIVQRVPVRVTLDADDVAASRLRPGLSALVSVDTRSAR